MKFVKSWLIGVAVCTTIGARWYGNARTGSAFCIAAQALLTKQRLLNISIPSRSPSPQEKPTAVALHFRIQQNLHINSHTPRAQYLIPTVFSIPESSGVKLASASYPAGADYTLPVDPSEKLLVYSGEFTIQAHIVAMPGDHLVEAQLHYQACDQNACMPPKTITVPIDVVGK